MSYRYFSSPEDNGEWWGLFRYDGVNPVEYVNDKGQWIPDQNLTVDVVYLGEYPEISLEEARKAAKNMGADFTD